MSSPSPSFAASPPHPTVFEPTPRGIQARALESLVHAFLADPLFAHVFPNEERREQDLRRLFEGSLRHAARVGGVSTVDDGVGTAVWTPRDDMHVSLGAAWRAHMLTLPFAIGPRAMHRLDSYERELDEVTLDAVGGDFAYLWMLGAHPKAQGRGLGRAALEHALNAMRTRGFERCVLRTQQPRNVSLYDYLGFTELRRHTPAWVPLETIIFAKDL